MESNDFDRKRLTMVEEQLVRRGIRNQGVLDAMGRVPRHRFVPPDSLRNAYRDGPLSIGDGQTISQPYMVALMSEQLDPAKEGRILEIGTGSGYQTAVLAELVDRVYTIERHGALSEQAQKGLAALGYRNIEFKIGDGTLGWAEAAPFDGILVTAGAPEVPEILKGQLGSGGRLVVPVGSATHQILFRITREEDCFKEERSTGCIFVPLIGKYGWKH